MPHTPHHMLAVTTRFASVSAWPRSLPVALALSLTFASGAFGALGKITAGQDARSGGVSAQGDNSAGYNSQQRPAYGPIFFNQCVISDINEACLTSDSKWLTLQPNLETSGFKLASSLTVSKPVVAGFAAAQENIKVSLVVSDLASFEVATLRFVGSMTGATSGAAIALTGPGVNLHYDSANPSWNTCFQVVDGEYVLSVDASVQLAGQQTGAKALDYAFTLEIDFCPQAPMSGQIIDPTSGHLYSLLSPATWEESSVLASELGGALATIDDAAENEWIRSNVANNIPGLSGRHLWLGINDVAREGVFVWSSGQPLDFVHWAVGEPDDLDEGGVGADDGQMLADSGLWSDVSNTAQRFGVVEFEIPACGPSAGSCFRAHGPGCEGESCCHTVCSIDSFCCEASWDGNCVAEAKGLCDPGVVAGPLFNPATGHQYYLLESGAWSEAQKRALSLRGTLAVIDDAVENEWIRRNVAAFDGAPRSCFIGLSDQAIAGVFQWLDHTVANYTNWAPGEPSTSGGNEHFVRLDGADGAWSVHPNSGGAGFTTFAVVEVSCIGDIDGDGNVGSADLGALLAAWNTASVTGDLNLDGIVDGADLGLLLGSWNSCGAGS